MDTEIHKTPKETISGKSTLPLDVRIVARLFYIVGGLAILSGILLCSGLIEPRKPYPVLFGAVTLANGLTQGVYGLALGLCYWLCDWGLRRGIRFVWWFLMVSSAYPLIHVVPMFATYPVLVTIRVALVVSFIVWLWFRRALYGVHLAAKGTGK